MLARLTTAWTAAFLTLCSQALAAESALPSTATAAELSAEDAAALAAGAAADTPLAPAPAAAPSTNPAMSVIFDGALAAHSDPAPLPGGHDPARNGFNLQQLELHLESAVDPYLHMQANIVFTKEGVEVEEAYADTTALPGNLQIRAGQFLTDFGRANPLHPHAWHFVDQPILLGKFMGPDSNRGMGAQLGWLAPLPWFVELKVSSTEAGGACCARSWMADKEWTIRSPADQLHTATLKQFFPISDDWSLLVGGSGQEGPAGSSQRSRIVGWDIYLRWRPTDDPERRSVSLQIEHAIRQRQTAGTALVDQAGYAALVAQFALHWEAGWRSEWGTGVANDPLDPQWTGTRTRHAAQLTYYPSHFARLRWQVSVDRPAWMAEPIYSAVLALETLIGSHGAHNY